jgi:hypothetical protein
MGWVISAILGRFGPGKGAWFSFFYLAGWVPGPGRTGAVDLAPTGIRSPDREARHAANNKKNNEFQYS